MPPSRYTAANTASVASARMDVRWRPPPALLAPAQLQIPAQVQLAGHLIEALLAHQRRPDPGQVPLRQVRVLGEQKFRRDESQHGISQKLQPLVAAQMGSCGARWRKSCGSAPHCSSPRFRKV